VDIAKPIKYSVRFEQAGDELVLRRGTGSSFAGGALRRGFLLIWLMPWSIGCLALLAALLLRPNLQLLLFACPFFAAWALVFQVDFGREQLRIGPGGLDYRWHALVTLKGRHVPLGEVEGVVPYARLPDSGALQLVHGVKFETLGRPVRFAHGVTPHEAAWLADLLRRHLQALIPSRTLRPRPEAAGRPADVVVPGPAERQLPSDSGLRLYRDRGRVAFVRKGRFDPPLLGGVTCLNLFWNGAVGVFLMHLIHHFEWGILYVLVPLGLIGLVVLLAWLAVLLAPFSVQEWIVQPGGIMARTSALGLGRARYHETRGLVCIELRRSHRSSPGAVQAQPNDWEDDEPCSLGFVGKDGRDLLVIGDLTEGEARWMGGEWYNSLLKSGSLTPFPTEGPGPLFDRWLDR